MNRSVFLRTTALLYIGLFAVLLVSCKSSNLEVERGQSRGQAMTSQTELIFNELSLLERSEGDRGQAEKFHALAALRYRIADYSGAEQLWYEAARSDPAWEEAYYNLASMAALQNSSEIAMSYCLIALKLSEGALLERIDSDINLQVVSSSARFRRINSVALSN